MPYIGKSPVGGGFHKLDNLTASATATYALMLGGAAYYPETANQLMVSLNGVIQAPQDSFTVSGSYLVFDSALTASDSIDFVVALGDVLGVGSVSDGAISTAKIGNDAVTTAKIADNSITSAKLASGAVFTPSYAVVSDQKTTGTGGGTSSTSFVTRDLNAEVFDPDNIVTVASNQFTLIAGTYIIEWQCPHFRSNSATTVLYDITGSANVETGTSGYSASAGNYTVGLSTGIARVVISANNTYDIRMKVSAAKTTSGFGLAANGDPETYTVVKITKIA